MTGIVIPDGGTIGSTSDTDAITIASDGKATLSQKPTFSQGIANTGTIDAGTLGSSVVVPASVGSSMVLIKSETYASATNWDVENCFSSSYDAHIVIISGIGVDDMSNLGLQLIRNTDAIENGANYDYMANGRSGYSAANASLLNHDFNATSINLAYRLPNGPAVRNTLSYTLTFTDLSNTARETRIYGTGGHYDNTHGESTIHLGARCFGASVYTGLRVFSTVGDFNKGRISSYGIKQS
tara:strand:- start:242 stop:961 length:720 start_codon:yes stop_codon:yes gene_type:complete